MSKKEMTSIEELNERFPNLVDEYSSMNKEQLLEQICSEVLDLLAMNDRVQIFMNECTLGMSYTTYTPEVIKGLINSKQEHDINQFCADLFEDFDTTEEIIEDLKDRANQL